MFIPDGAIIMARKIKDSDIWNSKPDKWLKIWFYILLEVNHKNKDFPRGTAFFRYDWICKGTKATYNQVEKCVKWLKQANQIATQKATQGIIISVLNYAKYQELKNYKSDSKSDTTIETKTKQKRNKSDNIYKNEKNEKNEKNTLSAKPTIPFSFKEQLNKMLNDKQLRMRIIATYWQFRGIEFSNKEQYTAGLKRELRAVNGLKGYTLERIKEVMFWLNGQEWCDWRLETVSKYAPLDLTKIKQK